MLSGRSVRGLYRKGARRLTAGSQSAGGGQGSDHAGGQRQRRDGEQGAIEPRALRVSAKGFAGGHRAASLGNDRAADQVTRSTIIFLISAIALAGFSPLGQTWAQFMMVWQR